MPGDVVDAMRYDLDGRLTWRRETSPAAGLLQDETMVYDARGKLLQVNAGATEGRGASTFTQWYSGLGNLVATDWDNLQGLEFAREEFIADPLGNRIKKTTILPGLQNAGYDHPDYLYRLDPSSGRVYEADKVDITTSPAAPDESEFFYDRSGNQIRSAQQVRRANGSFTELARESESRSYYGSDEKLRAFQEYNISHSGGTGTSSGVWEEYRYDPLGRRVMVITQRPPELCDASELACLSSVTRFVWSGDQLLWERKSAEGTAAYVGESSGLVSYTHAGGIDRPLAIWKAEVGTIVTHQNWRGQFARGTFGVDQQRPVQRLGQSSDCPQYPPSNGCIPVPWPGWNTTAWYEGFGVPNTTGYEHYWMGSLATGMQDASGKLYMRNRYYDPQTGQFTQPDPIGLAGGLNSYGFAAGDPVSYSDPYGLSADSVTYLSAEVKGYVDELRAASNEFDEGMRALENDVNFMYVFETGPLYGSPGMVWDQPVSAKNRLVPGDVNTNLPIVSIMFDWSHIAGINAALEAGGLSGGPVTPQMVVGHEVYVHALPFSRSGGRNACSDQPHSSPDTCGRRRHNELGARLGWPIREGW